MGESGEHGLLTGEWAHIVARAATLRERLDAHRGQPRPGGRPEPADMSQSTSAAAAWSQAAALGDPARFRRRLQGLGLEPTDLPECLDAPDESTVDRPHWCRLLERAWALARSGKTASALPAGVLQPAPEELPELLAPLVAIAVAELAARHPEVCENTAHPLLGDLASQLQRQLAALCQCCVAVELRKARDARRSGAENLWDHWMRQQSSEGLLGLWRTYPALARLVGTTMQLWVDRCDELLTRAAADLPRLSAGIGGQVVRLARVSPGLSDSHNGHATVMACEFRDIDDRPVHLVYKPKDVTAELVFADVCRWLGERGIDLGQVPAVWAMGDYGWVQRITPVPAIDAGHIALFFRRCGMLAVLLYVLGGTDCTAENLVAHGDSPVVIDAETILAPAVTPAEAGDSILDTLLFPRWMRIGGRAVDLSALGTADPDRQPRVQVRTWVDAGTTGARLESATTMGLRRISDLTNEAGEVQVVADHAADVLAGFDQAWTVLAHQAQELTAADGPLQLLAGAPVRVLVRMTGAYQRMLRESLEPNLLTDGLHRSLHFERVARYPLSMPHGQVTLALADAEREQLEVGDVPLFTVPAAARCLATDDGVPVLEFGESALGKARRRAADLTPAQRERQRDHLMASIAVSPPGVRLRVHPEGGGAPARSAPPSSELEELRRAACRGLVDRIAAATVPVAAGFRVWGLVAATEEQWAIAPLGGGFLDGSCGVATALFAAARTGGDPATEELAIAILRPGLARSLAEWDRLIQLDGIDGPNGVGGLIYGWSQCRSLAITPTARALLTDGLAEATSRLHGSRWDPPTPMATHSPGELAAGAFTSDSLGRGSAGWMEYLRGKPGAAPVGTASLTYEDAVGGLAERVVSDRLRLGVPRESPLGAYGLLDGLAGVLYALAAAAPDTNLPSLLTW